jgi:transglutaminase-like putative cysteine protease
VNAVAESVVVLSPRERASARRRSIAPPARPLVRLAAFFALGLYGITRWSTLMTPAPSGRLVGLLALATAAAGALGVVARGPRLLRPAAAILGALAVLIVALPIAGVPTTLVVHHHIGAIANGISQGLGAMPRVLVPYNGIDPWVRVVILLGAAVLLLDGAMILAFAPRALGDARRAGAALPLVALAVVPSTLMRPSLPYVHGLILLVLVAALVWGERLPRANLLPAGAITVLAGAGALALSPALDPHHPWIDYQSLAGAFSPSHVATFDWSQRYGPLTWPRTGTEVLSIQAKRGDYWKAENLDLFDGVHWAQAAGAPPAELPQADASALARWTQQVRVTVRDMKTTDVIAAGFAAQPQHVPGVLPGDSAGTWQTSGDLGPGDTYSVSTYSPRPSHAELAALGPGYGLGAATGPLADALGSYLSMVVPINSPTGTRHAEVVFAAFHSLGQSYVSSPVLSNPELAALMAASPYGRAYRLARSLAADAPTPINYVERVQAFLSRGFTYNENPPSRNYPLEGFLFHDRIGYCQQFAGSMALLLRMGGVPARVATGFTSGAYDRNSGQWKVSDLEAHAWVEAWFPRYGWVRFDPTPAVAPARGGQPPPSITRQAAGGGVIRQQRKPDVGANGSGSVAHRHGSSTPVIPIVTAVMALLGIAWLGVRARRRSGVAPDRLLAELERAFERSGRPLSTGTTLVQLERWFRSTPEAASYVRALRLTRYASEARAPSPAQRRALRARLAEGLGIAGRLRALWALPPRLGAHRIRLPGRLN